MLFCISRTCMELSHQRNFHYYLTVRRNVVQPRYYITLFLFAIRIICIERSLWVNLELSRAASRLSDISCDSLLLVRLWFVYGRGLMYRCVGLLICSFVSLWLRHHMWVNRCMCLMVCECLVCMCRSCFEDV